MTRRRTAKPNQKKQKQDILPLKWPQQKKLQTPSEILNKEKCEQETATTSTATTATATTTTKATRFFGCYLLTSLSPRFKGHTYIGFTVNPTRRIRQHNGEITSGAFRTKKKRPWEMVLCVHGFHTNVAALQFEWAWQHPKESIAVREAAASFKTLGGLANKIKLALAMLTLHPWQSMNLTVSFFSTKYMKHAAGCPSLPCQMKLHFCSMDELPSYENSDQKDDYDDEDDYEPNDEVSANCSDERIESSADGSIEMDPYSVLFRSCTTHKSGDNSLEGDCRGIDGSLRSESSSVKGVVEEHMQPLHQLPVEVRGSSPNTPNDQLRPCEEIWTDDVRESFPILGENTHLSGVHTSDNEWPPFLEEKQFSCDLPADVPGSKGKYLNECSQLEKEIRAKELRGSFLIIEEHIHPFQHVCPPEREQSSKGDFVSGMEDVAKKDEITCIVIDDINEEQCQQTRAQSPIRISNIVHPFFNEGFEVIELCTPSPDVRITTGSRKRRAASEFPDFIDLTGSPSFVQL